MKLPQSIQKSIFLIVLPLLVFVSLGTGEAVAGSIPMENVPTDPYLSGNATVSAFRTVDVGGHCRAVRHWGSTSYFVPTGNTTDWISMINHRPADVEMKSCTFVMGCPAGSYYHILAISLPIGGCEPCVGGPGSIGGPTIGAAATNAMNASARAAACS